jgi:hypothetical protein
MRSDPGRYGDIAKSAAEKELAAQAAGSCVASPSGPKNPQAESE